MDAQKIAHYAHKLEEELAAVERELATVGRKNPDVPGDWEAQPKGEDASATESDEKADKFEDYESDSSVLDTLETRWRDVKRALAKTADGTYGTCEACGEEIEEARLEANPAARACEKHFDR